MPREWAVVAATCVASRSRMIGSEAFAARHVQSAVRADGRESLGGIPIRSYKDDADAAHHGGQHTRRFRPDLLELIADWNRMKPSGRATRIALFDFRSPPMRAFHMAWAAFFLCFFAWFGLAPLMPVVREELGLSPSQVGWSIIASVAMTILARPAVGWLCDRYGPRRTYTALLVFGALPVMGVGLAHSFATFLVFRLLIGIIGASFVITQYHTSVMFAPQCVGTANATTAGWGNLGGGVVQLAMPLLFAAFVGGLGLSPYWGWRLSMVVAGCVLLLAGAAYYFLTQDTPEGDFKTLRGTTALDAQTSALLEVCRARGTWLLFVAYAACFGLELTIKNVAALYFVDYFELGLGAAVPRPPPTV